jgi:hypothetical protein
MTINDGGPAFPFKGYAGETYGMTLRDWFAGQALAGMLIGEWLSDKGVATLAYEYADAMLAAREVKP